MKHVKTFFGIGIVVWTLFVVGCPTIAREWNPYAPGHESRELRSPWGHSNGEKGE